MTTIHSSSIGSTVYHNNTSIGQVTLSVYGDADFSFVRITNTNYSVSTNVKGLSNYSLVTSYYFVASLPMGFTVYMAGRTHYGVVSGTVFYDGYQINNGYSWLCCTYSTNAGDSGGCVFTRVADNNIVIGIHDGIVYDPNTSTNYSYSTRFKTVVNDYYNIVLY